MKDAFKRCMRHVWPHGVHNQAQQRDLIKVFSMGWIEALTSQGIPADQQILAEASEMTHQDWWPDDSWKWW